MIKFIRTFIIVTIAVIFLFSLFTVNTFWGNPISRFRTERKMASYLSKSYPDQDFRIESLEYDLKFGVYQADIVLADHTFILRADPSEIQYDAYREELLRDHAVSDHFSAQLAGHIAAVLMPAFPSFDHADTDIYVEKGSFTLADDLPDDLIPAASITIYWVGEEIRAKTFVEHCTAAYTLLQQNGINPQEIYFLYNLPPVIDEKSGPLLFTLSLPADQLDQPLRQLAKQVRTFNQ